MPIARPCASTSSTQTSRTTPTPSSPEWSCLVRSTKVASPIRTFSSIGAGGRHRALVTGPVQRFARQIAGQGYICAAPSSFHGFEGPEPLAYDVPGTDRGNELKITKEVASYDEDARLSVDALLMLKTCNGKVGATGMCLGGHLAYRAALDGRVSAAVCYFATDIHSHSLGLGKCDDSLQRAGDVAAELALVCSPNRPNRPNLP